MRSMGDTTHGAEMTASKVLEMTTDRQGELFPSLNSSPQYREFIWPALPARYHCTSLIVKGGVDVLVGHMHFLSLRGIWPHPIIGMVRLLD